MTSKTCCSLVSVENKQKLDNNESYIKRSSHRLILLIPDRQMLPLLRLLTIKTAMIIKRIAIIKITMKLFSWSSCFCKASLYWRYILFFCFVMNPAFSFEENLWQ